MLSLWLSPGNSFSSHKATSLHGKLVHVSCIFPLIRPFLRSIAAFPSFFKSSRARLQVSPPLAADLSWIRFLMQILPNRMPLASPHVVDLQWWGDASTSFGIGVVLANRWAVWKWRPGFQVGPKHDFNIGWAEAVVIEPGLCLAIHLDLLTCPDPSQSVFLICSNNLGVVAVTNKGRSRSKETNVTLKHVFLLQARHRI